LFWAAALVAGGLATRAGRDFVRTMLDILRGRFSLIVLAYVLYVAGVVSGLASVGLWTTALAGATAFWFAGPGMVMFFTANAATSDPHYLRSLVRRALWFLLGVEFVVNLYVFPLAVEIMLVPVLTVIAVFGVLPPETKGAPGAKRFSETVLAAFGIFLFLRFVVLVATNFGSFASSSTLARFWLPPALTLAVLPFFYLLGVYMLYEQAFLRLGFFMEGEPLLGYAKRALVRRFGLNLGDLREFGHGPYRSRSPALGAGRRSLTSFASDPSPPPPSRKLSGSATAPGRRRQHYAFALTMTAKDVIEALDCLDGADVHVYVDGG
jgi:hypothetical protein